MDYSELDKVRRTTTPLQLDAVESFARGRLTRREFIKRGTIVGLSMASISAVIAACSGTTTSPSREQRWQRRLRRRQAAPALRPARRPRVAPSGSPASVPPARSTRSR